jgi:peptidoglycan/xylan/chitin deacetylase (PgdA/CDA1 family)
MSAGSELRWHVKKAARRLCLAATAAAARAGVRVLTYHRFAVRRHDPFAVSPQAFARQMEWLAAHDMALTLDDVLDLSMGRAAPAEGVLVTIDDGFESLHRIALPILAKYRIAAVAFLPAGLMGGGGGEPGDPEPRLAWSQIRELASAGTEIGSHGWSHRSFGRMGSGDMRSEASRSRELLAEQSGQAVRSFAYPFGRRRDFDAASAQALRSAGYICGFTSQHGAVRSGAEAYALPRVKVEGGEGMWSFAGCCRGGLDAWRLVDRGLWRWQSEHA